MNKYGFCALLLTGILLVSVLGTKLYIKNNEKEDTIGEGQPVIVTPFYPMYVATANLLKGLEDAVHLENLSENHGGCLHNYQLTTEDMQLLSTADVLVINGGGAENFLADVLKAYPDLKVIEASHPLEHMHTEQEDKSGVDENADKSTADEKNSGHDHEGHNHEGLVHSELAHIWMCPSDYKEQVNYIGQQLSEWLPQYAQVIEKNTEAYKEKITAVQMETEQLSFLLESNEIPVILLHEAFEPFCEELGVEVLYTIHLDEEEQISSGELAKVLSLMEKYPKTLILAEELYGMDLAQTIQREIDVEIVYLSPLTNGEWDLDGYINGMTKNIHLLKEALLP